MGNQADLEQKTRTIVTSSGYRFQHETHLVNIPVPHRQILRDDMFSRGQPTEGVLGHDGDMLGRLADSVLVLSAHSKDVFLQRGQFTSTEGGLLDCG